MTDRYRNPWPALPKPPALSADQFVGGISNVQVRGDIRSYNWDGVGNLGLSPDTTAVDGFFLDASVGRAQFQSLYARALEVLFNATLIDVVFDGDQTISGGGVASHDPQPGFSVADEQGLIIRTRASTANTDGPPIYIRAEGLASDAVETAFPEIAVGDGNGVVFRHRFIDSGSSVTTTDIAQAELDGFRVRDALFGLGSGDELTISGGEVTATKSYHTIDTAGDASSDDLDTINGGTAGDLLIIRAVSSDRTVVAKDATGNLALNGDFSMNTAADMLLLMRTGVNWFEISRSDN